MAPVHGTRRYRSGARSAVGRCRDPGSVGTSRRCRTASDAGQFGDGCSDVRRPGSTADLQNLRRSAEEFSAAVADSAALVERIKLLQEELAGFAIILAVVTILTVAGGLIALRRKEW